MVDLGIFICTCIWICANIHMLQTLLYFNCVAPVFVPGLTFLLGRQWRWPLDPCRGEELAACSCCAKSPGERSSSWCSASASSTILHEMDHIGEKHVAHICCFEQRHYMWVCLFCTGENCMSNNMSSHYVYWCRKTERGFLLVLMHQFIYKMQFRENKPFSFIYVATSLTQQVIFKIQCMICLLDLQLLVD